MPSHVAFVDLIKAYDTANHNILLDILERYGTPPCFVTAGVARIYQDLIVILKIEKEVLELSQTVGVQQGDNMAPVLFLFIMSAFAETLEVAWKEAGIDVCTVRSVAGTRLTAGNRKIQGHSPKEYLAHDLTTVEIFQCLYVDDGAFIFSSRDNLIRGIDLIRHHFARLGLEMHIGRGTAPSKMECVFFPPLGFFSSMLPPDLIQETDESDDTLNHDINEALTKTEQQQEETMKQHRAREELLYNNLEETSPIPVSGGQVTFCCHFKYLGSYVSFCLCNDYDIDKCIGAASQAMGALKTMWDCPHLDSGASIYSSNQPP